MKDQFDGNDSVKARNITLNKMFECYIATKYDLRSNIFHKYLLALCGRNIGEQTMKLNGLLQNPKQKLTLGTFLSTKQSTQ